MIPKIIHYCWFGTGSLSTIAEKCINSWKKNCPDYEIVKWDELNSNFSCNDYAKAAYKENKWSFVSDYIRLKVIYENGGIYMDTDVELLKTLDSFLENKAFISFESETQVNSGNIIACEKGNETIKKMLDEYNSISFYNNDGSFNTTPSPFYNTKALLNMGLIQNNTLQHLENITIYPTEYFCPKNLTTGELCLTQNSHAIHHFDGSWLSEDSKNLNYIKQNVYKTIGKNKLADFICFIANKTIVRAASIKRRIINKGFKTVFIQYFKKYILKK